MAMCKATKKDGTPCQGTARDNGYCMAPAHAKLAGESNVVSITTAKSAGRAVKVNATPAVATLVGSIQNVDLHLAVSKLAGKMAGLNKDCLRLSKKGGAQAGHGQYGTLRDQLADYASIAGEMEAELAALLK